MRVSANPIAPPNNRAYIFDTFGNRPDYLQSYSSLNDVSSLLNDEGYRVISYRGGAATLANFAKMKGAGVIVLSTHGYDPAVAYRAHSTCQFGKGLFRPLTPAQVDRYDPSAGSYADEFDSCHGKKPREPLLLVETASSTAGAIREYVSAREAGWTQQEIYPIDLPQTESYGLALLEPGLERIFGSDPPTFVFASACYSDTLASSFGADSYFGYHSTTYDCEDGPEAKLLFDRLAGRDGPLLRDTANAWNAGGFGDDNFAAHIRQPVVLSPAVSSVSPDVATAPAVTIPLGAGSSTPVTLKFDASMSDENPDSVLSVSGCDGATISGASWQDDETLNATLDIPKDATDGELTMTIDHAAAIGKGTDDRNGELDGNQKPSPSSGVEPNQTDYTWTLPCEQKLYNVHLDYAGTFSDQYSITKNGTTATSSESAQFDENRDDSLEFLPPLTVTPGAPTLNVTGQASDSSGTSCTIGPGDTSTLNLGVTGLLANVTSAGTTTKTGIVVAAFPPVTFTGNNCGSGDSALEPADFYHPPQGGVYDPGGMLGAAQFTGNIVLNVNALPLTQTFPFNYTETGTDGSTDAVSGSATLTVTLVP